MCTARKFRTYQLCEANFTYGILVVYTFVYMRFVDFFMSACCNFQRCVTKITQNFKFFKLRFQMYGGIRKYHIEFQSTKPKLSVLCSFRNTNHI